MQKIRICYLIETFFAYVGRLWGWLTFSDTNELFYSDLGNAIKTIQRKNYNEIVINKLVPYMKEITLAKEGYLITDIQALEQAQRLFINGKEAGKIDCLNALVPECEVQNNG